LLRAIQMKKTVVNSVYLTLILALPAWAAAGSNERNILASPPASAVTDGKYEFHLESGSNEKICHDFLENLKKTQPTGASLACEVKLDPGMKQFALPDWKGLDNKEYVDIAYDIEQKVSYFFYSHKEATKEEWLKDYTEKIRSGKLNPRLRQTRAKLAADAPELTVFGYTWQNNNIDACKRDVGAGLLHNAQPGEWVFIHDKARKTIAEIDSSVESESFFRNRMPYHAITHDSRLLLLESQPAANGYSIMIFGMDWVASTTSSGKKIYNFPARQLCRFSARNIPASK